MSDFKGNGLRNLGRNARDFPRWILITVSAITTAASVLITCILIHFSEISPIGFAIFGALVSLAGVVCTLAAKRREGYEGQARPATDATAERLPIWSQLEVISVFLGVGGAIISIVALGGSLITLAAPCS